MRQLYAKLDDPSAKDFPRLVGDLVDAKRWNDQGYGIFWSVNRFGKSRRTADLEEILSWFIEMDGNLSKEEQLRLIANSPAVPTSVIESKNGYHVYFNARGRVSQANYKVIASGLVRAFNGDAKATLITQLARVPGFFHWKDKDHPYLVQEVIKSDATYTEKAMISYFPPKVKPKALPKPNGVKLPLDTNTGDTLSQKLSRLNHESALSILSGTKAVNFEVYEFHEVSNGKKNIYVNGKSTSCFIDEKKMIGASPGGPTLWQWLKYYGHEDSEIAMILKDELGL